MNSPQQVRQFLQWYRGEGEQPDISPKLPDWVDDRVPKDDQRELIPIEDYDIKGRLSDQPSDDWRWRYPGQQLPRIEEVWRESTEYEGLEAFAWYVPFHFSRQHWGIYVDEVGLQFLGHLLYEWSYEIEGLPESAGRQAKWSYGDSLSDSVPGAGVRGEPAFESLEQAFNLALEILLRHEWYHHQVELLASYIEESSETMCYEQYHKDVYQDTFAEEACIEESLANAYVDWGQACSNRAPSRDVFRALFYKSSLNQPTAYQNYHRYLGSDFRTGGQYLGNLVKTGDAGASPLEITDPDRRLALGAELPFTTGVHRPRDHRPVPIYMVRPSYRLPTLSAFRAIQLETNYEITRSEQWNQKYKKADPSLQDLVDRTVEKLIKNVNLPGFRWRSCPRGYEYGRMNKKHRFVVNKNDREEKVELIDFGEHNLPKREYNCY